MHASCCFVVVAVKAPTSPAVGCTWLHVEHINNVHNTHSAVLTAHPHATATACAGHMSGPAHYSACRYCAIPPSNAVHPHTDPSRPQHLFLAGLTLQQATHHQHQHRCCSTCWWAAHTHTPCRLQPHWGSDAANAHPTAISPARMASLCPVDSLTSEAVHSQHHNNLLLLYSLYSQSDSLHRLTACQTHSVRPQCVRVSTDLDQTWLSAMC